jgi:hypothetical protein
VDAWGGACWSWSVSPTSFHRSSFPDLRLHAAMRHAKAVRLRLRRWLWQPRACRLALLTQAFCPQKGLNIMRNAMTAIPPKPMPVSTHGRPLATRIANSASGTGSIGGCRRLPIEYGNPAALRSSLK